MRQYAQAIAGVYDDWHPPIMARLWAVSDRVVRGQAPLLVAQMLGWWGGLGLIAAALRVRGQRGWGWGVVALGLAAPTFGWLDVAIKDAQLLAAIMAAVGMIGWWRLRGARVPGAAAAGAALLLDYATLVRANAPFATVPLALALGGWAGARRPIARAGLVLAGSGAAILLAGPVNHRLLGAAPAYAERTLPLYDLAGIAHRSGTTPPGLPPALWRAAERRGCYGPLMWDAYGDDTRCGFVGARLAFGDGGSGAIFGAWLRAIAAHPLAYAAHRLGHLNSTFRFVVGSAAVPNAVAPAVTEPNALGLVSPGPAAAAARRITVPAAASPLGWPVVWLVLAIADAAVAWRAAETPGVGLARALALSSLVTSASFAVISIAPDLRYHLWAMTAAALAALLLGAEGAVSRRAAAWTGVALGAVAAIGLAARAIA